MAAALRRADRATATSSRSTWAAPPPSWRSSRTAGRSPRTAFELHRVNNAPGSGLPMNIQAHRPRGDRRRRRLDRARARSASSPSAPRARPPRPAPSCYGRGGIEPTVTDANLVLGYLNPDYFAGGALRLARRRGRAGHRGARRAPARPVGRGGGVGHPRDRQHEHGAGHARGVHRARARPARSDAGGVRRLRARARLPAGPGARHPARDPARRRRRHRRDRPARRRGAASTSRAPTCAGSTRSTRPRSTRCTTRWRRRRWPSSASRRVAGAVTRRALGRTRATSARATSSPCPVPAGRLDAAALARVRARFDEIYAARYGYANAAEPVEVVTWKLSADRRRPARRAGEGRRHAGRADGRKGARRAYFPEARRLRRLPGLRPLRARAPACSSPAPRSSRSASRRHGAAARRARHRRRVREPASCAASRPVMPPRAHRSDHARRRSGGRCSRSRSRSARPCTRRRTPSRRARGRTSRWRCSTRRGAWWRRARTARATWARCRSRCGTRWPRIPVETLRPGRRDSR